MGGSQDHRLRFQVPLTSLDYYLCFWLIGYQGFLGYPVSGSVARIAYRTQEIHFLIGRTIYYKGYFVKKKKKKVSFVIKTQLKSYLEVMHITRYGGRAPCFHALSRHTVPPAIFTCSSTWKLSRDSITLLLGFNTWAWLIELVTFGHRTQPPGSVPCPAVTGWGIKQSKLPIMVEFTGVPNLITSPKSPH